MAPKPKLITVTVSRPWDWRPEPGYMVEFSERIGLTRHDVPPQCARAAAEAGVLVSEGLVLQDDPNDTAGDPEAV